MTPFQRGEVVCISGRRGTYKVERQEGDVVHLWGGIPGREKFRAVSVATLRQPRERPVPCEHCGAPTWAISRKCIRHEGDDAA